MITRVKIASRTILMASAVAVFAILPSREAGATPITLEAPNVLITPTLEFITATEAPFLQTISNGTQFSLGYNGPSAPQYGDASASIQNISGNGMLFSTVGQNTLVVALESTAAGTTTIDFNGTLGGVGGTGSAETLQIYSGNLFTPLGSSFTVNNPAQVTAFNDPISVTGGTILLLAISDTVDASGTNAVPLYIDTAPPQVPVPSSGLLLFSGLLAGALRLFWRTKTSQSTTFGT